MKQRVAAKVLRKALNGMGYRESSVRRAVACLRNRRFLYRKNMKKLRVVESSALTAALIRRGMSVSQIRFMLDGVAFQSRMEKVDAHRN